MSMNNNNGDNCNSKNSAAVVPMATKIGLLGTGVLIGLIAYPFVRKALAKIQPGVNEIFDNLTGKAEDLAEKASDLMAKARESYNQKDKKKKSGPGHDPDHSEDHAGHSHKKPSANA